MKRRILAVTIFIVLIASGILAARYYHYVDNRYWDTDGETKHKRIGGFEYEYKVQRGGTWITKITPKRNQDISVLEIPSRLGGKSVVKLGGEGDKFYIDDDSSDKIYENLFGEDYSEDSTRNHTIISPEDIYDLVGQIEEIRLPESLKWITLYAFEYVQDGKVINIPGRVKTALEDTSLTEVKWKEVSLSDRNRRYQVKNGCLCSKNGKTVYGIIEARKTVAVPEGAETLSWRGDYSGAEVIKIPASVTKIERESESYGLSTTNPVTIQISEDNKRFAVKDGSVYDKTSGELISGNIKDGVLKIPDTVKVLEDPRFLGDITTLKKVIIPAGVTSIHYFYRDSNYGRFDLTLVFEGRVPPKVEDWYLLYDSTVYVPKGCKEIYRKEWEKVLNDDGGVRCSFREMEHF